EAVGGAVGGAVAGDARVREIEAGDGRAVGAEDLRSARHRVAHGREGAVLVAELHRAEAPAEVGIDPLDLIVGRRLPAQVYIDADRDAVLEGGLATESEIDLLLEHVVAQVSLAHA